MAKLPSFPFYPGDWQKDPALRRCSKAAKGVWIDMLCLMFECEVRGELSTGGAAWGDQEIASAIGGDSAENVSCIRELLTKGVASRNGAGAIYSRRLVRDEQIRSERSKAGSAGGKASVASKTQAKHQANPNQITEGEKEKEKKPPLEGNGEPLDDAEHAELVYRVYPRKVAKPEALKAIRRAFKFCPFPDLINKTTAFAGLWQGKPKDEMRYCPHPTTWFNQHRFNDEPGTWHRPSDGERPKSGAEIPHDKPFRTKQA